MKGAADFPGARPDQRLKGGTETPRQRLSLNAIPYPSRPTRRKGQQGDGQIPAHRLTRPNAPRNRGPENATHDPNSTDRPARDPALV